MTTTVLARRLRWAIAGVVALVLVGAYTWHRATGVAPARYSAIFADASELVPHNDVRINGVVVGHVTSVRVDGLSAKVGFTVAHDVVLPEATTAEIRQVSLLGEQFVALVPRGAGRLGPGTTIPLARTRRATDFESLVAVGGQLAGQLSAAELNQISGAFGQAFGDDPQRLGRLIDATASATQALAGHRGDLAAAIDQVDQLTAKLAPEDATLAHSLDEVAAGMRAVAAHNADIGTATSGLARFSTQMAELLSDNQSRLERGAPELRQVLGEIAGSLPQVDAALQNLYGFNADWSCIGDGNFLNITFVMLPNLAHIDYGPGACNPEQGQRSRDKSTGLAVTGVPSPPAVNTSSQTGAGSGLGQFLASTARGGATS